MGFIRVKKVAILPGKNRARSRLSFGGIGSSLEIGQANQGFLLLDYRSKRRSPCLAAQGKVLGIRNCRTDSWFRANY